MAAPLILSLSVMRDRVSLQPNDHFTSADHDRHPKGVPEVLTWGQLYRQQRFTRPPT